MDVQIEVGVPVYQRLILKKVGEVDTLVELDSSRNVVEDLAAEISKNRALLTRSACVLSFRIYRIGTGLETWSIVVDREATVIEGRMDTENPWVTISCDHDLLVDLLQNNSTATACAENKRLRIEGDPKVLTEVANCLRPPRNWLSIRN